MERNNISNSSNLQETNAQEQLLETIQNRRKALANSKITGKLEFLWRPKYPRRLQIFNGKTYQDPTNCLFAEIYQVHEIPVKSTEADEDPLEMFMKPNCPLSPGSIAQQIAEFINDFFPDAIDLPIFVYQTIKARREKLPVVVFQLPPLVEK